MLFVAASPRFRRPPTAYLAAAAVVPLLAAWSAYAQVSATVYYATVTWNRLLLQGCVPVFGLFAVGVRRLVHPPARNLTPVPSPIALPPSGRGGLG